MAQLLSAGLRLQIRSWKSSRGFARKFPGRDTSTPFSWEIDASPNFHTRSITTNHGWKITLDRGLNLFQGFEFSVLKAEAAVQEARLVKGCEINYIAIKS